MVFSLLEAGVYEFHNGPARRVFMDGRLEVASRETFETYVRLHQRLTAGDPRWEGALGRLGEPPLVLVDHEDNAAAEATLLASPHWRCVYFDAVAAVFLRRDARKTLEQAYPTIDFAARHFRRPASPPKPVEPDAAYHEALVLERVGSILAHRPVSPWSLQIPMSLVAIDRAREEIARSPAAAGPWMVLGHAALALATERRFDLAGAGVAWDPGDDLPWAQATAAYRAAIARAPNDAMLERTLAASFALRGLGPGWEQAALAEAQRGGPRLPWAVAERVAGTYLHLGMPGEARQTWISAAECPSEALRMARLADADGAAWKLADAEAGYRRARALDPSLADASVGLALAALERGDAGAALEAARAVLQTADEIEPRRRRLLLGIEALCAPQAR
jgi:hypothetical protein